MRALILIRGGGDLASGAALRLWRVGLNVMITELECPLVVRRSVAFAQAVFSGQTNVEGTPARRADSLVEVGRILAQGEIPVLIDPHAESCGRLQPLVLVDGRMTKRPPELGIDAAPLVIGLGPGFSAGEDCHAVIETQRGHGLGRVLWQGAAQADTGEPEIIAGRGPERILRAPGPGQLEARAAIGDLLAPGQLVAVVGEQEVRTPIQGVLRGLLYPGQPVQPGMKIGDVDPRGDPAYCRLVSDKALAIGGGVLEAILTRADIRRSLWGG